MFLLRLIGGLLLLLALGILGWDAYRYAAAGGSAPFRPAAGGELWYALDPGSLNLTQAVIERYLWPPLWDPGLLSVLLWPAAAVLAGLGILLYLLGTAGRRRRR